MEIRLPSSTSYVVKPFSLVPMKRSLLSLDHAKETEYASSMSTIVAVSVNTLVAIGVAVGIGTSVGVGVPVGRGVRVEVAVMVAVGRGVSVTLIVSEGVGIGNSVAAGRVVQLTINCATIMMTSGRFRRISSPKY